jgi:hypothetical protein
MTSNAMLDKELMEDSNTKFKNRQTYKSNTHHDSEPEKGIAKLQKRIS